MTPRSIFQVNLGREADKYGILYKTPLEGPERDGNGKERHTSYGYTNTK